MIRVLFDEDVPRPLRRDLPGFEIRTVVEAGWSGIRNGELLRRAESAFDVFLTADRNLPFQQNLRHLRVGIVVLAARSTRLDELRPLASSIAEALRTVGAGEIRYVPESTGA